MSPCGWPTYFPCPILSAHTEPTCKQAVYCAVWCQQKLTLGIVGLSLYRQHTGTFLHGCSYERSRTALHMSCVYIYLCVWRCMGWTELPNRRGIYMNLLLWFICIHSNMPRICGFQKLPSSCQLRPTLQKHVMFVICIHNIYACITAFGNAQSIWITVIRSIIFQIYWPMLCIGGKSCS